MKHGVAHRAVLGHFCERHFGQQLRFQPVHAFGLEATGRIDHGGFLHLQRFQLREDAFQRGFVEPGADLAGVAQFATVTIMQAQQQCAERTARTFRIGVADDHEFLAMLALELDPVAAAPRHIRRAETFADQAFHLHLAGAVEQRIRGFVERLGEAQQRISLRAEDGRQRRAAFLHRHFAQVDAVEIRQIKQVIEDVATAPGLEGILQGLKIRHAVFVGDHHFAVEPGRFQPQRGQRFGLLRQLVRPVMAIAGEQLHLIMIDPRHDPVTVELDLVAPLPFRRAVDQGGQFRFELGGKFRLVCAGERARGLLARFGRWLLQRFDSAWRQVWVCRPIVRSLSTLSGSATRTS